MMNESALCGAYQVFYIHGTSQIRIQP